MGWETRQRGRSYYCRSRRVDGRVVREYVGSGEVGESAAALDAIDREQRKQQAKLERQRVQADREADRPLETLERISDVLCRCNLVLAGYHLHNRGEWRKRR